MGAYEHRGEVEGAESETLNLGMSYYPGYGAPPGAQSGAASSVAVTNAVACAGALVATRNAVPYSDWLAAPAPRNAAACPDGLMPPLAFGTAAPTPRNAVAYPDVLVEHFGPSLPAATRSAASCTGMVAAHLESGGLPTAGQDAASSDPGMLMAHLSSGMSYSYPGSCASSAAVNGVAYPGGLSAVTKTSENATGYAIDVYEGVDGFDFDHLNPTGIAAAALPFADKVVVDVDWDEDEVVAGAAAERARGAVLGSLGLAATALAVAGITAGGTATLATALGLFAMLIAGVTLFNVHVSRA